MTDTLIIAIIAIVPITIIAAIAYQTGRTDGEHRGWEAGYKYRCSEQTRWHLP